MRYRAMAGIMLSFAAIIGLTACTGEGHLDNHVYIVEKGGQPTEDTVVDWLDINNTTTFNTENIYQQKLSEKQLFLAASLAGTGYFYFERAGTCVSKFIRGGSKNEYRAVNC